MRSRCALHAPDQFHGVLADRRAGRDDALFQQVGHGLAAHLGLEQDVQGPLTGLATRGHRPG
jgi:hypothetical protein